MMQALSQERLCETLLSSPCSFLTSWMSLLSQEKVDPALYFVPELGLVFEQGGAGAGVCSLFLTLVAQAVSCSIQ